MRKKQTNKQNQDFNYYTASLAVLHETVSFIIPFNFLFFTFQLLQHVNCPISIQDFKMFT